MDTTTSPNPAAEAARAEQAKIMTDATHPLHSAWKQGNAAAVDKHLRPWYEKAYPEHPPDPLETTSDRAPALEGARRFLERVATDKAHPWHDGYRRGDPAILEQIEDEYRGASGLSRNAPATRSATEPSASSHDAPETDEQYNTGLEALKAEWQAEGVSFEDGLDQCRPVVEMLCHVDRDLFAELASVVGDLRGLRILHKLSQHLALPNR